jgi:hypothetical protein
MFKDGQSKGSRLLKKGEVETLADKVYPEKETVSKPVPPGEEVSHYMKKYKAGRKSKHGGKLSTGSKVKSQKQAVAIGLSVARERGADVPKSSKVKKGSCIVPGVGLMKGDITAFENLRKKLVTAPKASEGAGKKTDVFGKWEPIPHGTHGGMRKWTGSGYVYSYPTTASAGQAFDHHMQRGQHHLGRASDSHSSLMDALAGKKVPHATVLNHPEYKKYKESMARSQHHYSVAHNASALQRSGESAAKKKLILTPAERRHLRLLAAHEKDRGKTNKTLPKIKVEDSKAWLQSQKKALKGKRDLLDKLHKELSGIRRHMKKSFGDDGSVVVGR